MDYQIIEKQHVANTLIRYGVENGDEIIVGQFLTMRDPQAQTELYYALHECMDEMGLVDVNLMGEQIPIATDDPKHDEYDFQIRFWRKANGDDIKYNEPLRQAKKLVNRR